MFKNIQKKMLSGLFKISLIAGLIFFPFGFISTLFAQSAKTQLEDITGQKIDVSGYSSTDNNPVIQYDYNHEYGEFTKDLAFKENDLGIKAFIKKDWTKAIRHFNKALKYLPENSSIQENLKNARYNKKWEELSNRIVKLRAEVQLDQKAIKGIGGNITSGDFETWANQSVKAKEELEGKLLSVFLEAAQNGVGPLDKFTKKKAKKFTRSMNKKDIKLPEFVREFVSEVKKDKTTAKKTEKVLDRINLILTGKAIVDEITYSQWLELSQELLKLGVKDPKLSMLISSLDASVSLVYSGFVLYHGSRNVENLTNLTEKQLKTLKVLSKNMKKHVEELNKVKTDLTNLN